MNPDALAARLRDNVRGRLERDFSLAGLTTYRLGGPASMYFEPADVDDLAAFGMTLRDLEVDPREFDFLILGRGSNLVISDRGWPGFVIRLGSAFSWIEGGDPLDQIRAKYVPLSARETMLYEMRSGASTTLPLLANWAARRGLSGVEFTVAIPGSVGGAVRMNAGAHGSDIGGVLSSVRIFRLSQFEVTELPAPELDLSYRHSSLTADDVVLEATFGLAAEAADDVRSRMESYRKHRAETQPGALQNAGSVFKNPSGDSAGRLVEAAGLKGFRVGGAAVSELHANFFIATEGATAQDVFDLVHAVRSRVHDDAGLWLEPEVRFVGEFDEPGRSDG